MKSEIPNTPEVSSDTRPKLAIILKSARQSKGMTLAEAAEQLRVRESTLQVFEGAELDCSELSAFERGYLRNYAALLGVSLEEFEHQFPDSYLLSSNLSRVEGDDYQSSLMTAGSLMKISFILILILIGVAFSFNFNL